MKKFKKNIISAGIITAMLTCSTAPAIADTSPKKIIQNTEYKFVDSFDETGYMPDFSESTLSTAANLPSRYSAVDDNLVTTPKDQDRFGTCWSFATLSSAESYLIKNRLLSYEDADLSEYQLAYFAFNRSYDPLDLISLDLTKPVYKSYLNNGATFMTTTGTLADWKGPVLEKDAPYSELVSADEPESKTLSSEYAYSKDVAHLEQSRWINPSDIDSMKQAIYTYGSVSTGLYYLPQNLSHDNSSYYENTYTRTNHAIAIVGWDDNYSADNFRVKPESDGAWLVKNSYGTENNVNGYFWLSYETKSLNTSIATTFSFGSKNKYDYNYQYDGCNNITATAAATGLSSLYYSNIYRSQQNEYIQAVGTYCLNTDAEYEVKVYRNPKENVPNSGQLCSEKKGRFSNEGYYTIPLNTCVYVDKDDTFSVVMKISTNSSETANIPVEYTVTSISYIYEAYSQPGQSFTSADGTTWQDRNLKGNVRLKAYTKAGEKSEEPTTEPVTEPVTEPATEPVTQPTTEPTTEPVTEPTSESPTTPYIKKLEYDNITGMMQGIQHTENLDKSKFNIYAVYSDGSKENVTDKCQFTFSGTDIGPVNIKATYDNYYVSFNACILPDNTELSAEVDDDLNIALTWTNSEYITSLSISRSVDDSDYELIANHVPSDVGYTWYTDTTALPGHSYKYSVVATIEYGDEIYTLDEASCTAYTPPKSPKYLFATKVMPDRITLAWDECDCSGYYVMLKEESEENYSAYTSTTKTKINIDASSGKHYTAYIIPYLDTPEGEIESSTVSKPLEIYTPLESPEISVTCKKPDSATIRWSRDTDADGYTIYRSDSKYGNYKRIKRIDNASCVYTDRSAKSSKKYYYKVSAYKFMDNERITGALSKVAYCKVKTTPPKPVIKIKKIGRKSVRLGIQKNSGVRGYEVKISRYKYKEFKTVLTKKQNCKISGLKTKRKYYIKIRAYTYLNGRKIYGKYSKIASIKTK